jgi:hypothetical protein
LINHADGVNNFSSLGKAMASKNLEQSWQTTVRHLEAARQQLPLELPVHLKTGSLLRYGEWLSHNELELAFEELEDVGLEVECKQSGFWSEMLAAAEEMSLPKRSERCRQRLTEC